MKIMAKKFARNRMKRGLVRHETGDGLEKSACQWQLIIISSAYWVHVSRSDVCEARRGR